MPPRKNKTKKRAYRRKRRPRKATLSGFPSSKMVKLRYVENNVLLNAAAGGKVSHVFRANSLFDPDYTGTGHQPMGFDQWKTIYQRYTVLGSKITIRVTPTTTTNVNQAYLGVCLSGAADPLASYTTINNLLESKLVGSNYRVVGSIYQGNSGSSIKGAITKSFSAKKFFGVNDVKDGSALSAEISANPAKDAYFAVWAGSVGGNDPGQLVVSCQIDYIAVMKEPKNLDGS